MPDKEHSLAIGLGQHSGENLEMPPDVPSHVISGRDPITAFILEMVETHDRGMATNTDKIA